MEDIILPQLKMLSQAAIVRIHDASLEVLSRVGVRVEDPVMLEALHGSGCGIEKDRVFFPPALIDAVCKRICRSFDLAGPKGTLIRMGGKQPVIHTSGGMPFVLDLESGQRRLGKSRDLIQMTQVINQLPQIDINCAMIFLDDVPAEINEIRQCEILLRHSTKPLYTLVGTADKARYIVDLFNAAPGLNHSPDQGYKGLVGISPESPLNYPKTITDVMKVILSAGLPTIMLPAPLVGFTAPMTLAGGLVQQNASMLAFTAMADVIQPATPLVYGARLAFANMRTGSSIWGVPNVGMAGAYAVQMADYYGFVSDVYGLSCSACIPDTQAGYEKMANGLLPLMAGADMISGPGALASLTIASSEQLIIDNEILRMQRKIGRGIAINEDTLAADAIAAAAKGESYLLQPHTLKHLRSDEVFIPEMGCDSLWDQWETRGCLDVRQKAREKARQMLGASPRDLTPDEGEDDLSAIMAEACAALVAPK